LSEVILFGFLISTLLLRTLQNARASYVNKAHCCLVLHCSLSPNQVLFICVCTKSGNMTHFFSSKATENFRTWRSCKKAQHLNANRNIPFFFHESRAGQQVTVACRMPRTGRMRTAINFPVIPLVTDDSVIS